MRAAANCPLTTQSGDSYTSSGFSISGAKPSASNPMGNPRLPGNTQSGGLTWPGFLATELNTSLTLTFNFAVAGATVDSSIVQPYMSTVPSIADQVKTWTTNLESKPSYAPWTAENALFGIYIGVNDVGNSFTQSGEDARINKDLDRYFSLLGTLYAGGARNFVLLTIPRMTRSLSPKL
jgi:phospholipase/lecithinase/hemolysin